MFAFQALETVEQLFLDGVDFSEFELGESIANYDIECALDNSGYWLTGSEYHNLRATMQLLEQLVGRAHIRSV